ncbi:MAG TPA: alpha/beta fold hydrolase [Thermoleophilaceae bacterium]|nr:alpha/beta fold hydrolase [Thermoleophilaceae bacterium]
MGRTETGTAARDPDETGSVERGGVRVHWERYGSEGPAVVLLPTWSIVHSRHWKGQIAYLARHFRVVTWDGRGNGFSDRPADVDAYSIDEFVADGIAVMDAAGIDSACIAGMSMGGSLALQIASRHPERVDAALVIAPTVPHLTATTAGRPVGPLDVELDEYEGWAKFNSNYWRRDYRGFLEFFFGQVFCEPHSTKQIEDCVSFGLDTDPETLILTQSASWGFPDRETGEKVCRSVRCPVVVIHGTEDQVQPFDRGVRVAELTGGQLIRFEQSGHAPQAREPVQVNLILRELAERAANVPPARRSRVRSLARPKRALFVSSPIGLGHAWRDVAIADELRRQVPGLQIQWLAQDPVTTVLNARGETIHPASSQLAGEAAHIDREAGEHDLHAFQAIRRLDEIFCANFMLFNDIVRDEQFDLWIGDEAWELDHFLHENPELKTAPFAWLTDFVGFLPMEAGGEREAELTTDYNAEMLEHVERYPSIRDRAIFVGDPEDVIDRAFGPGLPDIREWTEGHYDFGGYVPGFDPQAIPDRAALRAELGYGDEPLCIVSVGGSGVGWPMLQRVVESLNAARERVPGLRTVVVTGPRIDPASVPPADGLEVRGYVHELYKHLAACDVAVVQGGLTTTMELVATGRPFVALPLASHFEQRYHVRHRLDRYGATSWLDYADTSPEELADAIATAFGSEPSYRAVDSGGAARAAALIAELV